MNDNRGGRSGNANTTVGIHYFPAAEVILVVVLVQ